MNADLKSYVSLFHCIDLMMTQRVVVLIQSRANAAVRQSTMNSRSCGPLCGADTHLVCVPDGRFETKKNGLLLCFKSFPATCITPVRIRINFPCSAFVSVAFHRTFPTLTVLPRKLERPNRMFVCFFYTNNTSFGLL